MAFRRWVAQLDLVAVLLFAVVVELVLNRLAVPVLRPMGLTTPPAWHRNLDLIGLFSFHLASILAACVVGQGIWARVTRDGLPRVARPFIAVAGLGFVGIAAVNLLVEPTLRRSLLMEVQFIVLIGGAIVATLATRAPAAVKLGLIAVLLPFAVHFYATAELATLASVDEARFSALPDRARLVGQHAIALAAVLSPLLLSPRPLIQAAMRPAPMVVAALVASMALVVLRQNYEVGHELALRGLGVDLGPGAPPATLALYVAAAASAVWTVTSNLLSTSSARRQMGLGFALVVASGYSFAWPLAYLTAAAGVLAMCSAALRVQDQERDAAPARFTMPPIPDAAWTRYVAALGDALGATADVKREGTAELISYFAERGGRGFVLRLQRDEGRLLCVDIATGAGDPGALEVPASAPVWSLMSKGGLLDGDAHPAPPRVRGAALKTGDPVFDRRFRLHDDADDASGGRTGRLLDDALRARAAAALDGWMALWADGTLEYRVYPGRGAPLDHPVAITELAFRAPEAPSPERLLTVLDLVLDVARRAPSA